MLSALKTGLDHTKIISIQQNNPLVANNEVPQTKRECSRQLRIAKREVCEIVQQSFLHQDSERNQRIKALESSGTSGDRHTARILHRLKKAEDIKMLFQKLQRVRQTRSTKGVNRIEIPLHPEDDPKSCTQWTQVEATSRRLRW